jgi:hypothetical protein
MLERDIEAHLVKRVQSLGGEVRKTAWIGRNGAPDRFVMLPEGCFWVELKRPGQKAKPHQQREHERLRKMGQRVEVIDSIEGVEALLG